MHMIVIVGAACAVGGAAIGYGFRSAIASELSKLSVKGIVARLEAAAKKDSAQLVGEVTTLAADLRKYF